MDQKEIDQIFYRDGYRLAASYLDQELSPVQIREAIRALYETMDQLLEAFLQRAEKEGQPVACKKGCAWCCHQAVFAVTHEFLYLHEYVQKQISEKRQEELLGKARDRVKITLNKSEADQLKIRAACPFLENGSCSVYAARPMACRIYLSASAASCKKEHDLPSDTRNFPGLFDFPLRAGRMMNEGFVAWLKQSGLQVSELAIEQGYASMITLGLTTGEWIKSRKN